MFLQTPQKQLLKPHSWDTFLTNIQTLNLLLCYSVDTRCRIDVENTSRVYKVTSDSMIFPDFFGRLLVYWF